MYKISVYQLTEDIVTWALFIQMGASGLAICSSVYLLSSVRSHYIPFVPVRFKTIANIPQGDVVANIPQFVLILLCLYSFVAQIFIPSFFSSQLIDESEQITYAVFESQWIDRNEKCKRAYKILVERTFQSMSIYSGRQVLLSLPTFEKVTETHHFGLHCKFCCLINCFHEYKCEQSIFHRKNY